MVNRVKFRLPWNTILIMTPILIGATLARQPISLLFCTLILDFRHQAHSLLWYSVQTCNKNDLKTWWITAKRKICRPGKLRACEFLMLWQITHMWPKCHLQWTHSCSSPSGNRAVSLCTALLSCTFFFVVYFQVPTTSDIFTGCVTWSFLWSPSLDLPGRSEGMRLLQCGKERTNPGKERCFGPNRRIHLSKNYKYKKTATKGINTPASDYKK